MVRPPVLTMVGVQLLQQADLKLQLVVLLLLSLTTLAKDMALVLDGKQFPDIITLRD
jgi:hypothetical protein